MLEEAKQSQKHGRSLYKFFKQHKQLKFIGTGDDEYSNEQNVYFEICETLEYYDEEDLETLIANKYSIFYSNFTPFAQAIIKAVFIYHRGSIRVRSCFCLSGLSTLTSCGKMLHSYDDSLPHPHLVDYNCLGGNLIPIEEAMSSGDWDLAIEQAISATKNINFMDSVVFSTFAQRIDVTRDRRCIILPDDTELTIQEFYDVYAKEFNNI
jgi:hypothetical protein